jgi:hypothetical protein
MHTLSKRIVSYLIEYLGKFKFIFKTILDYESGDQMGSFDAKKPPSKISCLGTFTPASLIASECSRQFCSGHVLKVENDQR